MRFTGNISFKGDKSISHRAAILASLNPTQSVFDNFSNAADCQSTLNILKLLGVKINFDDKNRLQIGGQLKAATASPKELVLDAENSGTTMRLMTGFLSGLNIPCTLTGDESLLKRPMQRTMKPLEKMGAVIRLSESGTGPVKIYKNNGLNSIRYTLPVGSAQIKTAVLMAGLFAKGETEVYDPFYSRDHTERMLDLDRLGGRMHINNRITWKYGNYYIPGDISSAAYFIALALTADESNLLLKNVSLNEGRISFLKMLQDMGADIQVQQKGKSMNEPFGDIRVSASKLTGGKIDQKMIPSIIDEIPILSVIALHTRDGIHFDGVGELRYKESDRIKSILTNLTAMGAVAEEFNNDITVYPLKKSNFIPVKIRSNKDHRIAMSMYIAGLSFGRKLDIDDPESINISFPGFFEKINQIRIN